MQSRLDLAKEVVEKAGKLAIKIRDIDLGRVDKNDSSDVTIADLAGQIFINSAIMKAFPEDALLGEESDLSNYSDEMIMKAARFVSADISLEVAKAILLYEGDKSSGMTWAVDPIDGTAGFVKGESFGVLIALIDSSNGDILMNCVALMNPENELYESKDVVVYGFLKDDRSSFPLSKKYYASFGMMDGESVAYLNSLGMSVLNPPRRSIERAALSCEGFVDVYIYNSRNRNIWDIAPRVAFSLYSGMRVFDLEGRKLDFTTGKYMDNNTGGYIAVNPNLEINIGLLLEKIKIDCKL